MKELCARKLANEIHDTFNGRYYEEFPSIYPQLNARRHDVEGNLQIIVFNMKYPRLDYHSPFSNRL